MIYIDPNRQQFRFAVNQSLNDWTICVCNAQTFTTIPLNESAANSLDLTLPDDYCHWSKNRDDVDKRLEELARLNGLVPMTKD